MTQLLDIGQRVNEYHNWLKQKTSVKGLGSGWAEITTPFLNRHNDHIQIFARQESEFYELNDDGETLRDLEISGCSIDTPRRKGMLDTTLNGFGVTLERGILRVRATQHNFPMRKHSLVQAIAAVNDMFYASSPSNVANFFKEDVAGWLEAEDIRAVVDVQFVGKSGFQHRFDFAVPRSRAAPERLIRSVNRPTKDSALSFIVAWSDTQEARPVDSRALAILNDNEHPVVPAVIEALHHYRIETVLWSERFEHKQLLAA
ncbi:DUF1829 domain-containing protein [uncultured Enterovirga sp.]|uniref:DUF1829 domain-containing protein n=1 Tax=uncultured Enterovirga sp. TaxID=2026352 RepID=UPI0035CCA50E